MITEPEISERAERAVAQRLMRAPEYLETLDMCLDKARHKSVQQAGESLGQFRARTGAPARLRLVNSEYRVGEKRSGERLLPE